MYRSRLVLSDNTRSLCPQYECGVWILQSDTDQIKIVLVIDVPRGFHKVFNNVSKGSTEPQNCTGKKCMECLACYRKDSGTDVIVEMVK